MTEKTFLEAATSGRVIQLSFLIDDQPVRARTTPEFQQRLTVGHQPGVEVLPNTYPGVTFATETLFMATHSGTHIDSLSHIALDGVMSDGTRIDEPGVQVEDRGVRLRTGETMAPIVSRGILLDFPSVLGVERIPADYVITPAELHRACEHHGVELRAGDTVLFRSGWDTIVDDRDEYLRLPTPGPDADTARVLAATGITATGSDTLPYEVAPSAKTLEVHAILMPQHGIYIFEMMDLRELAATGVREFLFVAAPLRLRWGTGSPINPLAILPDDPAAEPAR